jgi:hypothetical protein
MAVDEMYAKLLRHTMALNYAGNFVAMFVRKVWLIHGLWEAIPANVVNAGLIKPGKELTMKLRSACRRGLE